MHARPAQVLVVEDERIVARDLERTLGDLGYAVSASAASCDEAIERASQRCPDLVLMDIRLQGVRDGIETAEILQRDFRVPVVFLTAYADDLTLERAKRVQPYGYLLKPIKSDELRSTLEVALYRHGMDARLRQREHWFSSTLRSLGDAVISIDLSGRVTFMNAAAEALTGEVVEQARGRAVEEVLRLVAEGGARPVEHPGRQALRQPAAVRSAGRTAVLRRDGATRIVDVMAAPIVDEGGVIGAVLLLRDVTEERNLQHQRGVADRLASVGAMAAGMAGEVSEPLSLVMTNTQIVAEELQRHRGELRALLSGEAYAPLFRRLGEIEQAVSEAMEGARRLTRIVTELRALARPAGGRPEPVDVRALLNRAGEVVANEIRQRACLAMELGQVPLVEGDAARLGQVFVNLLLNAAQAIPPGNAKGNEVRVVGRTSPEGDAIVEIRDTGCGIASALRERIFDPFFSTKPRGSGTGLGLAICHGIVRSMGGRIVVESEENKGSLFRVILPPAPSDETAPANLNGALPSARPRVLVVDDEALVGASIKRALEPHHQVVCVGNVRDAMALLERGERFDVIFCDLILPDVTGMDFYDDLLGKRPDVARRLVFLAGSTRTAKSIEFMNSVSNRCIAKPFSGDALERVVRETIACNGI